MWSRLQSTCVYMWSSSACAEQLTCVYMWSWGSLVCTCDYQLRAQMIVRLEKGLCVYMWSGFACADDPLTIGARERRQLIPHVRFQVPFLGPESHLKSGFACAGLLCVLHPRIGRCYVSLFLSVPVWALEVIKPVSCQSQHDPLRFVNSSSRFALVVMSSSPIDVDKHRLSVILALHRKTLELVQLRRQFSHCFCCGE